MVISIIMYSRRGISSTINLDVEWKPLAVLDTPKPAQLPTINLMLWRPLEMTRSPDLAHTPVRVVGANIL